MYGRKYMGLERATFLVDGKGKIYEIWRKVKIPGMWRPCLLRQNRFEARKTAKTLWSKINLYVIFLG